MLRCISLTLLLWLSAPAASSCAVTRYRPHRRRRSWIRDLSSYGAGDLETPQIDALATEGIRFDQFYENSPICSPTRAALFTGRSPGETDDVLFDTSLLQPGTSESIYFTARLEPGHCTFGWTFPRHATTMRGIMQVRP